MGSKLQTDTGEIQAHENRLTGAGEADGRARSLWRLCLSITRWHMPICQEKSPISLSVSAADAG